MKNKWPVTMYVKNQRGDARNQENYACNVVSLAERRAENSSCSSEVIPRRVDRGATRRSRAPENLRRPLAQLDIVRELTGEWRRYLTNTEISLLLLILDQTAFSSRASYGFSYRMLENGNQYTAGTRLSRDHLMDLVGRLAKLGFIEKVNTPKGMIITPNLDWRPEQGTLPVSKRVKKKPAPAKSMPASCWMKQESGGIEPTPSIESGGIEPTLGVGQNPSLKEETEKGKQKEKEETPFLASSENGLSEKKIFINRRQRPTGDKGAPHFLPEERTIPPVPPAPPSRFSPEAVIAERASARKPVRKVLKPGAIEQTFRRAFEEAFAGRPGAICKKWGKIELGIIRSTLITGWTRSPEELHAFVDFSVRNWELIIGSRFRWMTKQPPALPVVSFFVSQRMTFMTAFFEKSRENWLKAIPDHQQRRFHELVTTGGKTEEEARMIVAKESAKEELRKELAEGQKRAADELSMARRIRQEAQRPRYDHNNPHPDSQVGRERRHAELKAKIRSDPNYKPVGPDDPLPDLVAIANMPFRED